jgi:hypothetical protein
MKDAKFIRWVLAGLFMGCAAQAGRAQEAVSLNSTAYALEVFGSAATGGNTPFWISSNRYGLVPLKAGNGYLRSSVTHHRQLNKGFYWSAGLDLLLAAPRYRNLYVQQLYAGIGYKSLWVSIGSQEQYASLWDKRLSSGDMIQSANARPAPGIRISLPRFVLVPFTKGWLQFKGDLDAGRSFDTKYLEDFVRPGEAYIKDMLWHHKSLFFRVEDTQGGFPLFVSLAARHTAQWGGTSTDAELGKQPRSLNDFFRIFFSRKGGEDANESDRINVLGSHHIAYDMQLGFRQADWELQAYYQHLCYDKSGISFYNRTDGLWGIRLDLFRFPYIRKVVAEYLNTRDQSGPFHYIGFNHDVHPGMGGGGDDYYNNGIYTNGYAYFNRSVGSPLLPSPEYNTDGTPGFLSNRILDWHTGIEGDLSPRFSYRVLCTFMNGWGTAYRPFLHKKTGISFLTEITYTPPHLSGWTLTGSLAGDTGNVFGRKSYGACIGIRKQGLLN